MTQRLLIVGCGDVGRRVLKILRGRWHVAALVRDPADVPALRVLGAVPLLGDLDRPATLARLSGWADAVLHLAPPQQQGARDERTRHLLTALSLRRAPRAIVYVSTTGVYGDCGGARVKETRAVAPTSARAQRRVDAETCLRAFARQHGSRLCVLRAPGIYAADRDGGHPRERLLKGLPVPSIEEDVFTNHIHADDLARACVLALHRAPTLRPINVCDDSELRMGEYFELVADLCGLPPPERLPHTQLTERLSPMALTFLAESRRLDNLRLKAELGLRLRYPHVRDGLK